MYYKRVNKKWKRISNKVGMKAEKGKKKYMLYNYECSICLDSYKNDDNVVVTWCGHIFHQDCINRYIGRTPENEQKCPNCRSSYDDKFKIMNREKPLVSFGTLLKREKNAIENAEQKRKTIIRVLEEDKKMKLPKHSKCLNDYQCDEGLRCSFGNCIGIDEV